MAELVAGRERSVLVEERDFFLRSLRDLEAEHAAGDIDQADYEALREDYTVRAAQVLRELEAVPAEPVAEPTPAPPRRWGVLAVRVLAVALILGGAVWAVAAATGTRLPGEGVSGGGGATADSQVAVLLARAVKAVHNSRPTDAVADYTAALRIEPGNVEALTGQGGLLVQLGEVGHDTDLTNVGIAMLTRAEALDPAYFPAFGNLGEILYSQGRYAEAAPQLQAFLRLAPKTAVTQAALATATQELRLARAHAG